MTGGDEKHVRAASRGVGVQIRFVAVGMEDGHIMLGQKAADVRHRAPVSSSIARNDFDSQSLLLCFVRDLDVGEARVPEDSNDAAATRDGQILRQYYKHVLHAVVAFTADKKENGHR